MNTINAVKSVPRIKTILGNTCKDLESYLLHLGHKWCPWNRGFSNERFIVVVLFFVASCTTSKFWRTQDLMSAFLKQLRKKNLSFYLVICTFICGSYESTGKCHAGFIFLFFLLPSIRGLSFFSLLQPLLRRQLKVNQLLSNRKKPWVAVQVLHLYHKTIASFRYWISGGKLEWFSAVQSFVHFWLSVYSIEKVKWDLWTFFCVLNTLFISLGSSTNFHGDLGLIK